MPISLDIYPRTRAAALHLLISAAVAALAAGLVFGLWFPGAYRLMAGGQELFLLLTSVDVALGPLLTFAVFNLGKGWPQLRRDLAVIGLLQASALAYGLHTVYAARPVALVFEVDRLRVITAAQVYEPELPKALPAYRELPLTGPWTLGTRAAAAGSEHNDAIFMAAIDGVDIAQRPSFWQPYAESTAAVLAHARPVDRLATQYPARAAELAERMRAMPADPATALFLPVTAHSGDWVAVLDSAGNVAGFLPVDGFFR